MGHRGSYDLGMQNFGTLTRPYGIVTKIKHKNINCMLSTSDNHHSVRSIRRSQIAVGNEDPFLVHPLFEPRDASVQHILPS